jgi:hypothetical protein
METVIVPFGALRTALTVALATGTVEVTAAGTADDEGAD